MVGQVYKAHSNVFYVMCDGKLNKCVARGILKHKSDGILVGDYVKFDKGAINEVLERKNRFIRPSVSNLDMIVAVVSPEPKPDLQLIDKLLISAIKENVDFVIAVNKQDLSLDFAKTIKEEYKDVDVKIIELSAKNKNGIDDLKNLMKGKVTAFAGQSAVGKTSLVNSMFGLNLKTGELSEKISRGKHTTTRSEIFNFEDYKILDTPGFAVIDAEVSIDDLPEYYPEYFTVSNECKFRGCKHVNEPFCRVKELVNNGKLSRSRYNRYVEIYNEITKRREVYEKN